MTRALAALLLTLATCASAGTITFPAHVTYTSARWAPTYGNRLRVCPLPNTYADCAAGTGWVDPDEVSPIPGYWLRHTIVRADGAVVLYFCRNGTRCPGDE